MPIGQGDCARGESHRPLDREATRSELAGLGLERAALTTTASLVRAEGALAQVEALIFERLIASLEVPTRLRDTSALSEEAPERAAHIHEELERLERGRGIAATPWSLAGLTEACW